ncbi:MAG: DoxX family protein [Acidobacteriota bacterium]
MIEVIGRFTPQTFALLRIVSGLMFMMHGTQKIFGWPGEKMSGLPPMIKVAGWIEIIGGGLILVGLFAGIAALICSGEMAVAYFMAHAAKGGMNPLVNKGELAALYCFVFLYIAAHGAGIWSIDNILRKRVPVTASTGAARV